MNTVKQLTCAKRVKSHLKSRVADLQKLWTAYQNGEGVENLGTFEDYGLCFDYVASGTFDGQEEAYFRYQISCGGPSDEFRFFCNHDRRTCYKIEYWFMDWFDGASLHLTGKAEKLMREIWEYFVELGMIEDRLNKAMMA